MGKVKEDLLASKILQGIKTMREIEEKSLRDIIRLKKPHTNYILSSETKEKLKNEEEKIKRSITVLDEVIQRTEIYISEDGEWNEKREEK